MPFPPRVKPTITTYLLLPDYKLALRVEFVDGKSNDKYRKF